MKLSYLFIASGFIAGLIWSTNHYHSKYLDEQQRADAAESQLRLVNAALADMQTRQRDVAALDEKYTRELEDAKKTIEDLRDAVSAGSRRLQLNATCPVVSTASRTASVDDVTAAELTPDARQNYFRLREQLVTSEKQTVGLQDYIRQQRLK